MSATLDSSSGSTRRAAFFALAVAGVAVAVGAVVAIYFRRAKKKISDKLGIDENQNKEVESDDIMKK